MATSLVLVFLFDNLPDIVLDPTFETTWLTKFQNSILDIRKCDHLIADPILQVASRELNTILIPKWSTNQDEFFQILPKKMEDTEATTSVLEDNLFVNDFNDTNVSIEDEIDTELFEDKSECELDDHTSLVNVTPRVANETTASFPEKVPYLVAIFESLANVTAQTCGGTLLSSNWVVTAASCIDVLGNSYGISNTTEQSTYTVIANTTNPLVDGSAHNVTQILLHPQTSALDSLLGLFKRLHSSAAAFISGQQPRKPSLALMKIEPGIQLETADIIAGDVGSVDVMMYGWVLVKNETGNDAMRAKSFPARTLSALECKVRHHFSDESLLCLAANDSSLQMLPGGPVIAWQAGSARASAVALTDDPPAGCPLPVHAPWLRRVMNNNKL